MTVRLISRTARDRVLAIDDVLEDPLDEDRARPEEVGASLDPGQDEQILDHPLETLGLGGQTGQQLVAGNRVELHRPLGQDLGAAVDRGDRRPQLMGQDADEAVRISFASCRQVTSEIRASWLGRPSSSNA